MNENKAKIAVIGGDMRQIYAAEELIKMGYTVSEYGFGTLRGSDEIPLSEVTDGALAVLLPVPVTRNGEMNMPFSRQKPTYPEVLSHSENAKLICGGMFPDGEESTGRIFDLCRDESFNIMNAVPTAEGALAVAMENTDITINGMTAAVTGFGRIGKALCRILSALGARVIAVSRSEKDRALSGLLGYRSVGYRDFAEVIGTADVIFNTVPCRVITPAHLDGMKKSTPIIELASKPGGVDGYEAICRGIRVISAQSLPGKTAPVTAGKIIARRLDEKIKEVRV